MLGERDYDPERRLEVVHVDVEGRVDVVAENVVVLRKSGQRGNVVQIRLRKDPMTLYRTYLSLKDVQL